jgi:hypothetical protein
MIVFKQICALFLVLLVSGCVGQDVFLERPVSQRVELGSPARLNCTVNETLATSPEWRLGGSVLTSVTGEVEVEASYLLLPSVQWSQIAEYTCVVTVEGNSSSASATVNITGYVKPFVEATEGVRTINHEIGEEEKIECPVAGYPGPSTFYWESLDSEQDVTGDTSVETGVFVDEDGKLDVSRVEEAGSELFACVGVDAAGNSARTRIRVTSVSSEQEEKEEEINLVEWYFILAYSVGGVMVVVGVAVVVFACWLHHDQCCERVAEKRATRLRVRRSKVALGDMKV